MFFLAENSAPLWLPGTVHTDTPISWLARCNLIYWPQRLDYKAEIHVPTRGVMSIHSPEQGEKKGKKYTHMHTCINPKHLEAAVNMIDLQRGKRRLPARPVLHGGSQSHTTDRLHTLHGDSITSCSLDAAHENPLQHGRLSALTSATLLDSAGTSGVNTAPLSAETPSPRPVRAQATRVCGIY